MYLRLEEREHYFLQWRDGQQVLDSDIFGLVEDSEDDFDHEQVDLASARANTRLLHVIGKQRQKVAALDARIAELTTEPGTEMTREGVFFKGQTFDALRQIQRIVASAKRDVFLVDGYVDPDVLDVLSGKQKQVTARILTTRVSGSLSTAAKAFTAQYGELSIRTSNAYHDRFLIIDDKEFFHFGSSIKDAGKRGFMFSRIEEPSVINALRSQLQADWAAASETPTPVSKQTGAAAPQTKWVDPRYVSDSGLDKDLEARGFKVAWCNDDKLARRIDLEGWEEVILERDGTRFLLKFADPVVGSVTLIKKRVSVTR